MAGMNFTWDETKAAANAKKHGVTFEEAKSCFWDPLHIVIDDPDHSSEEDHRMILIGMSLTNRTLVVVHVDIQQEDQIRIISARLATKKEKREYEDHP